MRDRRRGSRHVLTASLVVLMLGSTAGWLAGCSGDPSPSDPYSGRVDQALESATTAFERDVLADRQISRAEYEEAVGRYVDCLESHGARVDVRDQLGYYVYDVSGTEHIAIVDEHGEECAIGTTVLVEALYVDRMMNPGNIDPLQNIADCLGEKGLVPQSFTREQLAGLLDGTKGTDNGEHVLDLAQPEVADCFENPSAR